MSEPDKTEQPKTDRNGSTAMDYALVLGVLVLALWAGLKPMAETGAYSRTAPADQSAEAV